ncbi:acetyl-CoA hydrolase/transferase family protein [Rhodococcus opacus]|uniref:Acetyl-CoA hydrolase/transferase family protein n=1 Tax=Rhodococcus opacus TaxID=37919 RepID=A0AAX3YUQ0_RHOOP|nr:MULTISPECIES: acetyl-CoA hydrolase/transferase family protein [Rhodococcus]MCZ4586158.1 acetyl-CoA hydrolase/transferase family protein [Rhodococcus opacus]QSE86055.1 acetyl-CoA hydrolase/transferase family protein [Rhodococcus koreensis]WLF51907.1 acetyl-CoA hydrolase/transferase family protein [Rhodococcus opacus]
MLDLTGLVRSGDGIWWGQGGAEPTPLVDALIDAADRIGPVTAFSGASWNPRLRRELPDALAMTSYGALGELRHLSRGGRLVVVPCHYSALPRMFAAGRLPCDVGIVQVSPPDGEGLVTLGVGVDYMADAIPHTRTLIGEINHRMPATTGGPRLPLSVFAAVVETDRPFLEVQVRAPDEVDLSIAGQVASIIDDGDTLQMGVGSLPHAVLDALAGHRDLGFHSGIITDGVLALIEKGVVTGARKEIDPGIVVTGSAFGTNDGYCRIADLPIEFRATSYTHSPVVLSQLRSFVSVNSAIEIDLSGQVGAELARGRYIGAVGGQVDFSRAAALTGSRSIIALRSTVPSRTGGTTSTIVPTLSGLVTTGRVDVDAVVTEHGVAVLTGCTDAERARKLVRIAAPEHREALERSARDPRGTA